METLNLYRKERKISQRRLGIKAGISYKSIQLIETGRHDPKLSTLENIAEAFGYPHGSLHSQINALFELPTDSIAVLSERLLRKEESWKIWLFNFVDLFRQTKDERLIQNPPSQKISANMKALLASTVETLCDELEIDHPWWCQAIFPLTDPWFISGIENLKATSLVESPVHFRKRKLFVLKNFLERV